MDQVTTGGSDLAMNLGQSGPCSLATLGPGVVLARA